MSLGKPLSIAESVFALQQNRPTSCPYCGHQEFLVHTKTDETGAEELAVYAMPSMVLKEDAESSISFKATVGLGPDKSFPVIAMQCTQCGRMDLFNYLFLFHKVRKNV